VDLPTPSPLDHARADATREIDDPVQVNVEQPLLFVPVVSMRIQSARQPSRRRPSTRAVTTSDERAPGIAWAPAQASPRAMAKPIPRLAPATNAVRPASEKTSRPSILLDSP
jgi:hypothetical protein